VPITRVGKSGEKVESPKVFAMTTTEIELLHEMLGHPRSTSPKNPVPPCAGCQMGKGHRDPFPPSETKASRPFELVHGDIAGPMRYPTPEGCRFFVLFVEHHAVRNQHGYGIAMLRTDGETALTSKAAKEFFAARPRYRIRRSKTLSQSKGSDPFPRAQRR